MISGIWGLDNLGKITADGNKFFYLKDHLGSIRATVDQNNNLVSAQDYDMWGYPMENRSWQSRSYTINNMYKFTSKERDDESNYDYFGARYYDAKIGRWGGVEPLMDKYLGWSPYQYALCNPSIITDLDGLDVFITGPDAINSVKALNESTNNRIYFSIDQNSGELSYEGTPITKQEIELAEAINSNIKVNLKTTRENFSNGEPIVVGVYDGSEWVNGFIETSQTINLRHAKVWKEAGGADVGKTVIHEILESYIGAKLHAGSKGDKEKYYKQAHNKTVKLENPKEFYPLPILNYATITTTYMRLLSVELKNEKTNKIFLLYKNE